MSDFERIFSIEKPHYITKIPEYVPYFEEISKYMRANVDILKKEISDHVDKEIIRFKNSVNSNTVYDERKKKDSGRAIKKGSKR